MANSRKALNSLEDEGVDVEDEGVDEEVQASNPPAQPPPVQTPPANNGKKRVQSDFLKGGKEIFVGGAVVKADADGVIEVDAEQAIRLLGIPGYTSV